MSYAGWFTALLLIVDMLIRVVLSIRVIMRRMPVGTTLAWLFVVLMFPLAGAFAYLFFGELRLGRRRAARAAALHGPYQAWLTELRNRVTAELSGSQGSLANVIDHSVGIPALPGNRVHLLGDWQTALRRLIDDIDRARRTCHLEFYIWNQGGMADEVGEALLRAAARGVYCRVLLDDVGSRRFLDSEWYGRLRFGGIRLQSALPASLWRVPFVRFDLRMHRKIVVIDGAIAYTGSLNLVDPGYFKQDAGVGQWIDAMVRVEGPAVEALAITFLEDWSLETGESLDTLENTGDVHPLRPRDTVTVQVVPSGPAQPGYAIERILVSAVYSAQRELILTTPYFVPDESLLQALVAAAQRGVAVTLITPEKVDSRFVQWASRAFLGDLVAAGVRVLQFEGGLLHTKSLTIDGSLSMFGSLNLDPRSLRLNFEITLAIYDAAVTSQVRDLQLGYAKQCHEMTVDDLARVTSVQKFIENTARLVGPLL